MNRCRNLLSRISDSMKDQENVPYTPQPEYNIFHILGVAEKEVIMCRFLADLLNPEGAHACGILFLKSFLEHISNSYGMSDILLAHTDVITEFVIDSEHRIDIVIQNAQRFIPIEVKIYAGEQEGQCYDYYNYAKSVDSDTFLIYLTRFGDMPSQYSRKNKNGDELVPTEKIKCISWEKDIYTWLSELLIRLDEPLRQFILQYMNAIRSIADRTDEKMMERNLEILYASADFFNAGIQIEKSMKAAKVNLIRLVFDDFKRAMETVSAKYGLVPEQDALYYSYEGKQHEKFYDCYSTYPGLNYVVKKAQFSQKGLQMWFRIEVEHNLFAGISLFDRQAAPREGNLKGFQVDDLSPQIMAEAARYLDRDVFTPSSWWLAWCYPNGKHQDAYYEDVPDFKHMNPCAVDLVENQKRKDFVKHAVRVFEEHLLKYLL